MDAEQRTLANPLGMDEGCENCRLCEARERVVHGYGDVGADFLFVGEAPDADAEAAGIPFGGERGRALRSILGDLGLCDSPDGAFEVENAYLTYLARCRHPDRPPADDEIRACDPYLTAEVRMINPEIVVPVGGRALRAIAAEYTTRSPDSLDVGEVHATAIRGRGFELLPTVDPAGATAGEREAFVGAVRELLGRDYRQTKGRRGRETRRREDG